MPDPYFQPADPMANRRPYSWQTDEFQTKAGRRQNVRATVEDLPTQLRPNFAPGKHDHLVLFQKQHALVFSDPRMFGRVHFSVGREAPAWWASPRSMNDLSGAV